MTKRFLLRGGHVLSFDRDGDLIGNPGFALKRVKASSDHLREALALAKGTGEPSA